MADDRIEIEIAMDDGQIRKGFIDIAQLAEKTGKKVGDSIAGGGENGLKSLVVFWNQGLELANKVKDGISKALSVPFEALLEGEAIIKIGEQFDFLSKRAGIAGDALTAALKAAAGGKIDDTDLLKVANKAIIELGASAQKLPQLLEIAKKSTSVFGGEVTANLEQINQAIASGQTRQLKSLGIFIDGEKAIKDYARALGVSTDALTLQGRQHAVLNAVLEKGGKAFEGLKSQADATGSIGKLKVAFNDLGESAATAWAKIAGPTIKQATDNLTTSVTLLSNQLKSAFGSGADQATAKAEVLKTQIELLSEQAKALRNISGNPNANDPQVMMLEQLIAQKKSQLQKMREDEEREGERRLKMESRSAGGTGAQKTTAPKIDGEAPEGDINKNKALIDRIQIEQQLQGLINSRIAAEEAVVQSQMFGKQQEAALDQIANERRLAIDAEFTQKAQLLRAQNDETHKLTEAQLTEALEQIHIERGLRLGAIQTQHEKQMFQSAKNINDSINTFLKQAVSGAIQSIGASLVQGSAAFSNFGKQLLGMLGDLAIHIGEEMMFAGMALEALDTLNGPGAVAAGAALIAVGGALKAFSSAGLGGGGASSGGGVAGSDFGSPGLSNPSLQEQKKMTQVHVNIQGSVFDSRETGMRIVEVLNEEFQANDGRLVRAS